MSPNSSIATFLVLADLALEDVRPAMQPSKPTTLPGNHCIWSSMVESAAFTLRAFLISVALTYGYSAYSRKLGH